MLTVLISALAIVLAAFLCSLVEAAILSLPTLRARMLVEEKRRNSKHLLYVKEHIAASIATIVIINNIINISGSMYVGYEVTELLGDQWLGLATGLLTFSIIVFGEVIPKALGERFKIPLALFFAKPVKFLLWLFHPVVLLSHMFASPFHQTERSVTEEEIKMMLKLGRASGTVESDEEVLINRVFRLNDLRAINIMKPLKDVYMLPADKTLLELKEAIVMSPYNRIAVYSGAATGIVGIVEHRVLLREMAKDNEGSKIKDWMLKPIFVNQLTRADVLMEKFQTYHQHLFIVQDNFGRNVGLVTMEDIFEELFGEIYDEKDVRFKMTSRKPA